MNILLMEFQWHGEKIVVNDEYVRGICPLCNYPILKEIPWKFVFQLEDWERFVDLNFEMMKDGKLVHEFCLIFPGHFNPPSEKSRKISGVTS